jgi:hypothetical protein
MDEMTILTMNSKSLFRETTRSLAVCILFFLLGYLISDCSNSRSSREATLNRFNLQHLDHLNEEFHLGGRQMLVTHIYCNAPDYRWTEAQGEGMACVDDAARAAVLYLRHYEITGNTSSLMKAKKLLNFIMYMQAEDGEFYNFIFADRSINRTGSTSRKSFNWCSARGIWAISAGYRVFKSIDMSFATELDAHIRRSIPQIQKLLDSYQKFKLVGGYSFPKWLIGEDAADATSELLLGLSDYYLATSDTTVEDFLTKLAQGINAMQFGDFDTFPHGAHLSWQTVWHSWGNGQAQALATIGKALKRQDFIESAELEARGFYSHFLIDGYMREFDITDKENIKRYSQIAYGIRPMAVGLIRLFEATGDEDYAKMAGLAASWFFGNNIAGKPMLDVATGRGFDGIDDSSKTSLNSGAESTIEALYSILETEANPISSRYLDCREKEVRTIEKNGRQLYRYAIFENKGEEIGLILNFEKKQFQVMEGQVLQDFLSTIHD